MLTRLGSLLIVRGGAQGGVLCHREGGSHGELGSLLCLFLAGMPALKNGDILSGNTVCPYSEPGLGNSSWLNLALTPQRPSGKPLMATEGQGWPMSLVGIPNLEVPAGWTLPPRHTCWSQSQVLRGHPSYQGSQSSWLSMWVSGVLFRAHIFVI